MLSLFFPGKTGANRNHFAEFGVADLLRATDEQPACCDLTGPGPDNLAGQVWAWGVPGYHPDRQTWLKARGANYYYTLDSSVSPAVGLLRKTPFDGKQVRLQDAAWLLPTVETVPHRIDLDDAGELIKVPAAPFENFCAESTQLLSEFAQLADGAVMDALAWDWPRRAKFIVAALSLNYRLNLELATRLQLLVDLDLWSLVLQISAADKVRAIFADLEKKSVAANSSGAGPSPA